MDRRNFIKTGTATTGGLILAANGVVAATLGNSSTLAISPDWTQKGTPIKHSWAGLGNVDQMRWILRRDMQEQLAMCHKEIGLKHVRAVGIFDDEMWVFDKNPAHFFDEKKRDSKRVNWRAPFYIFDSLVQMGISPVVTTCFTPDEMKTNEKTAFDTKANISPPRDWKEWEDFVKEFVRGLVDRYGIQVVRNWYFEVWNEPNLDGFWTGGKEGYLKMYQVVYGAIKSVDPSLRVGGPSAARTEWLQEFLDYGANSNCMPDYIIGHIYNNDSAGGGALSPFDGPQQDRENKSPNYVAGITRGARKILDEASFKGEFHMNEWGLSWHPFAPVRETANEAAFIVKTMSEVSQLADYFAYWCLSDIYNQVGYGRETFHGNYGMISMDGLKKPNYFAHQLLCLLGDKKVPHTGANLSDQHNAFVTRNNQGLQALFYAFDINYKAGDAPGSCQVEIDLPDGIDLEKVRFHKIDAKHNNIVTSWNEMGSSAHLKKDELLHLQGINQLTADNKGVKIEKTAKGHKAVFAMQNPGVAMLEVDYVG
ncbi:MAG: hypothetical protein H8M99_13745 [Gloeobacteraceae cyanobacterium ES-bin-144]|nr:hypothetical protein [Verrucomicrobiales bacterium]